MVYLCSRTRKFDQNGEWHYLALSLSPLAIEILFNYNEGISGDFLSEMLFPSFPVLFPSDSQVLTTFVVYSEVEKTW